MSIADDIAKEVRPIGSRCHTCRIIEELGEEGSELVGILAAGEYSNETIARALTKRGHNITGGAIRNHRLHCVSN